VKRKTEKHKIYAMTP